MRTERTELTKHITDADLRGIPRECQAYGRRMMRRNRWNDGAVIVIVGSLFYWLLKFLMII